MKHHPLPLALALALLAGPAGAAPRPKPPPASGPAQAAGILEGIADRFWNFGEHYWHDGRYEDRIALDYVIIQLEPKFIQSYHGAAFLIDSNGRKDEAEALLRQATAAAPERWETWVELGDFLFKEKRYREALAPLEKAVAMPGCWPKVHRTIGHAYRLLGDLPRSVAAWEEALRREPDDPAVKNNLERARQLLREQR